MNKNQDKGIADLPIVIILCVFLAAIAAGLSTRAVNRVKRIEGKQEAVQSFDRLVETCQDLNYGSLNEKKKLELDLNSSKILVSKKLAKLKNGKETLKVQRLPLPLIHAGEDNYFLQSGAYQVKLVETGENSENRTRFVLELSEI